MNVKITIPETLDDITVGQIQEMELLLDNEDLKDDELDNEILKVILNFDNVEDISVKDRNRIVKDIRLALEKEGEFKNVFELNGTKFGLIPNFDKISNGEYTDLIKYADNTQDLHRFLAVCYREVSKFDWFDNYDIKKYKGTSKHAETMKQLPMSIAKGVQVFFYNLLNDLRTHILMSTEAEQAKV